MSTNKYPRIIMDNNNQAVNPLCKKNITVEEWNDLLHHTHAGISNDSAEVLNAISELTTLVQNQNESITIIKEKIEKLEAYVDQDIQIGDTASAHGVLKNS